MALPNARDGGRSGQEVWTCCGGWIGQLWALWYLQRCRMTSSGVTTVSEEGRDRMANGCVKHERQMCNSITAQQLPGHRELEEGGSGQRRRRALAVGPRPLHRVLQSLGRPRVIKPNSC
jgi:hypothetical protein